MSSRTVSSSIVHEDRFGLCPNLEDLRRFVAETQDMSGNSQVVGLNNDGNTISIRGLRANNTIKQDVK